MRHFFQGRGWEITQSRVRTDNQNRHREEVLTVLRRCVLRT